MVGERWPTDSIRSSSPLLLASLLSNNFVLDIFRRPQKKRDIWTHRSLTCRIDFSIVSTGIKKCLYTARSPRGLIVIPHVISPFFMLRNYTQDSNTRKTAIKSILNCIFPGYAARLQYYDPTYTRATCVTYIKCACDDKRVGSRVDFLCM